MMDQQRSSWTVKKSCSHKAKKCSVKGVSFNYGKKIFDKKTSMKREKTRQREKKVKKEQEKALQKQKGMVI